MVSTQLKNISQIGSFPQIGVKIKNLWNHHLDNNTLPSFLNKNWKVKLAQVLVSWKIIPKGYFQAPSKPLGRTFKSSAVIGLGATIPSISWKTGWRELWTNPDKKNDLRQCLVQLYLPGLNVGWGKYTDSLRVTSSMQQETKYQLGLHPPNSSWVLRIYNDCGCVHGKPFKLSQDLGLCTININW